MKQVRWGSLVAVIFAIVIVIGLAWAMAEIDPYLQEYKVDQVCAIDFEALDAIEVLEKTLRHNECRVTYRTHYGTCEIVFTANSRELLGPKRCGPKE